MIRTTMIGVATALLLAASSANVSALNACNRIKDKAACDATQNCQWFKDVKGGGGCHRLRGSD